LVLQIRSEMPILCENAWSGLMSVTQERERGSLTEVIPGDALRGFFLIMDAWDVSADDARVLLGSPAERTYYTWRRGNGVRVPSDTLRRIGYIAGIYKALQILYSDQRMADSWIRRPNKAFGDRSPLERMRGGDVVDLAAVRSYLDAARAPWS
jgi:uncharacterized protein (DUF2384 family)